MDIEFEGQTHSFPDSWGPAEVEAALSSGAGQPKKLLSAEGIGSTLKMVGPSLVRGILGSQLQDLEEVQSARRAARAKSTEEIPVSEDEIQTQQAIETKRKAITELDADLARIQGQPSKPLEVAQSVVSNVAQNAPGIATAVATRNIGSAAALPGLAAAENLAAGSAMADSVKEGAPPEAGIQHAKVSGVAEVGFELLPMSYLIKSLGKDGAIKFAAKYLAREIGTELPTTAVQKISEQINLTPDKPMGQFMSELGQDLIDTGLVTALSAPLMAGGAHMMARAGRTPSAAEPAPASSSTPPLEPTPQGAPAAESVAEGGTNATLTPPAEPPAATTTSADGKTTEEIRALIASIDADLATDEDVAKAKETVAAYEEQRKAPANPEAVASWAPLAAANEKIATRSDDLAELGASPKSAANAANYVNPNTGDVLTRPILYGPENTEGLTPQQVPMSAGTYTIGVPSDDRPADYLKALHDTVEQWRQKFLPNSTVVLANQQLFSGSAVGVHQHVGENFHLIVPAVLRKPTKGLGAYNQNTQASAFYNATHEFGHALTIGRFFEGVEPDAAFRVMMESTLGLVSEEAIQAMPAPQQAVIREFNAMKARIANNSMTAEQFVNEWMSPGKIGRQTFLSKLKVAPTDNAMSVVKALTRQAVQNAPNETKKVQLQRELEADFLSLDEYLAEQTARHAYNANWDKNTPLGQFFSKALASLRQFFISLKKDGTLRPGTSFTEWIEGLSKADRGLTEKERISTGKTKGQAPKIATPKAKKVAPKAKVQKVQHNVDTSTDEGKQIVGRQLVVNLVKSKMIELNGSEYKELMDLLKQKDYDEFRDVFQRYAGKSVKFELTAEEEKELPDFAKIFTQDMSVLRAGVPVETAMNAQLRADAAAEWQKGQFKSPYFKAWFGDWQNDPFNASKVRRGAFIDNMGYGTTLPMGNTEAALTGEGAGQPLVVYHYTTFGHQTPGGDRLAFHKFSKGDIGFHFGTVRAAHIRATYGELTRHADLSIAHQWFEMEGRVLAGRPRSEVVKQYASTPGSTAQGPQDKAKIEGGYVIPTVLNLRNPLYIGEEDPVIFEDPIMMLDFLRVRGFITTDERNRTSIQVTFEQNRGTAGMDEHAAAVAPRPDKYSTYQPVRQLLLAKGYDGIIYNNQFEGDTSFIAFHPNQAKSLLGSRTFSRSDNMHMELDFDESKETGVNAARLLKSIRNFIEEPAWLRRALRRVQHIAFHTLQLQQLAHLNPAVTELAYMNEKNGEYNRYKSMLQAKADTVVSDWKELGKENLRKVGQVLQKEAEGKALWFNLVKDKAHQYGFYYRYEMSPVAIEKLKENGIDINTTEGQELAQLVLDAKNALLYQLDEAEIALISILEKRYSGATPQVLVGSILPVKRDIRALRSVPFFPQGRFGNLVMTIEEERDVGPGRDIVYREAFESRGDWEKAVAKAHANAKPGQHVRAYELTDQQYVLMALPTDFLEIAASELGLSEEQKEKLLQILQPVKRERMLNAYQQAQLGIKGYTTDALRSFANFTWHNANLLAKLRYRADFNLAIRNVGLKLSAIEHTPDVATIENLKRIKDYMERTRDYIMSPPNEAQSVRAFVSIAYLGLNIKTALVNFYGLVTTWSDMTSRYGQVEGNTRLARALKYSTQSIKLSDLNARRPGEYMPADVQAALDRAIEEGVLSQSYAYHLAGMANSSNLSRLNIYQSIGTAGQHAVDVAMWTFRLMELQTRRVTFLAQYEAAKTDPNLGLEDAYKVAVERTNKLQNDYSLGNRVPFMRGIKTEGGPIGRYVIEPAIPLATVFMTFMQHMAFHSYGGYELGERRLARLHGEPPRSIAGGYTMKLWLLTLLLAGYEGLPGAENILDLIDVMWRKFGGGKPFRQELREAIQQLNGDPMFWSRGLGHNIAGFDVSRSVGLGRFVPGTDVLTTQHDTIAETVGTLALDMAGASGAFVKFGLEAMFGKKGMAESLQKLPGGMGNIYTAYRWAKYGVRAPTGAQVTHDLQTGQLRDLTADEILGKALGFNPTIVSQNREVRFAQYDQKVYWQSRRQMLLNDYWTAHWQKDAEAKADVKKAVTEFNASIPADPQLKTIRITGADLARSLQAHERIKRMDEQQSTSQRRYKGLYQDVRESYDQP